MKPLSRDTLFVLNLGWNSSFYLKTQNPLDRIIAQLREAFVSELAQAVSLKGADKVRYKEKVVESDSERFVGRGNL